MGTAVGSRPVFAALAVGAGAARRRGVAFGVLLVVSCAEANRDGSHESAAEDATNPAAATERAAWEPRFDTQRLSSDFVAEGAAVGDLNGDGVLDLVAGARWYPGPDYAVHYELDLAPSVDVAAYSRYFLTFIDDLDGDGALDVINVGDAGGNNGTGIPNAWWYENPGPAAVAQHWPVHVLFDGLVSNESPAYVDLVGDARAELVFMTEGVLGWAAPGADPTQPWPFSPISDARFATPYVHGLGVGDVDGDGRADVIERTGYWRTDSDASAWEHYPEDFSEGVGNAIPGGAQMFVRDLDGDSDGDVIASSSGHGFGLSWYEQRPEGFIAHAILPPSDGPGNVSQLHALSMADLNGDGLDDLVTGKRYFAHASGDPGGDGAALLYWFELSRAGGQASFTPRPIHDDSGVGCSFSLTDVNRDGRTDVFTASKKGVFLHRQH